MSMYNRVFGPTPSGIAVLVGILQGVKAFDPGRLCDAWVEDHTDHDGRIVIAVYTRNGGGNRDDYAAAIESMRAHPWYERDEDDDFDSTYATFRFVADPDTQRENPELTDNFMAKVMKFLTAAAQPEVNTSQRWLDAIEALKNAPTGDPS